MERIITNAFDCLPETVERYLTRGASLPTEGAPLYEGILVGMLAFLTGKEMSKEGPGREPWTNIFLEYPYPDEEDPHRNSRRHADMYICLSNDADNGAFVEAKVFSDTTGALGTETTCENIGKLLNDLLRLDRIQKYGEKRGKKYSGYLLAVFDADPKEYLSYNKRNGSDTKRKDLLKSLFDSGDFQPLKQPFLLDGEVESLRKSIHDDTRKSVEVSEILDDRKSACRRIAEKEWMFYLFSTGC